MVSKFDKLGLLNLAGGPGSGDLLSLAASLSTPRDIISFTNPDPHHLEIAP
jgi:hypothetical protein